MRSVTALEVQSVCGRIVVHVVLDKTSLSEFAVYWSGERKFLLRGRTQHADQICGYDRRGPRKNARSHKSLPPLGACYLSDRGTGYLSRLACILAMVALQKASRSRLNLA